MDFDLIMRERSDKDELPQIIRENIGDVLEQIYCEFCNLGVKRKDIYNVFAKAMYGPECKVTHKEMLNGKRLNYLITQLYEYVYNNSRNCHIYSKTRRIEDLNDIVHYYATDRNVNTSEDEWQWLREGMLARFQNLLEIINYSNREVFSEKSNVNIFNLGHIMFELEDGNLKEIISHIYSLYLITAKDGNLFISKEQKVYIDRALCQMKKAKYKDNKSKQKQNRIKR